MYNKYYRIKERKETKTMKTNILHTIKNHEAKSRERYYSKAGKFEWMYSKTMQNLKKKWVCLNEEAVAQGLAKQTGDDEFNGYDFSDVCA